MRFNFCPLCGQALSLADLDGRKRSVCQSCGFVHYRNPIPAAAVLLVQDGQILLVKRKDDPRAGDWSLPAGFIEYDESPAEAALREMQEETGLLGKIRCLFQVYGACDDPRTHVSLIVYVADIVGGDLVPGDDAIEARFFPIGHLPSNIAFSSHRSAIESYRSQLLM